MKNYNFDTLKNIIFTKMQSLCFAFFLCLQLPAQDVQKAHQVIDTLASPYFWGRGYVNEGHTKAAQYVSDKFEILGLHKLDTTIGHFPNNPYFQNFSFTANVFGNVSLKSKRKLKTGYDFIPSADLPTFKGKLRVRDYDSLVKYTEKDIVYFKDKKPKSFKGNFIVNSGKKLTHTFAQNQSKSLGFYIADTAKTKLGKYLKVSAIASLETVNSQNVLGFVKGAVAPDTFLIICAHYDHLGGIGQQCYFPGANDNASGIAMLLQFAEYYVRPEHQPKYSVLFIAFGAEEVGLLGSKYYTEHPLVPLKQTKFVVNLDLMGSGLEGITVVNGSIYSKEFEQIQTLNTENQYLKIVKPRGKAANSDHYYFSEKGVKSIFIYSLGEITAYHDVYDTANKVPLSRFSEMYRLILGFMNGL
jgi:aminopeptidase YwaD